MNKALLMSAAAAVALALSGSVFAKGSSHRAAADDSASSRFTESDCSTLTIDSARSSCMRSINANGGSPGDMGTGTTSGTGEGMTSGSSTGKRMHKRSRVSSDTAAAQHQHDKANGNQ